LLHWQGKCGFETQNINFVLNNLVILVKTEVKLVGKSELPCVAGLTTIALPLRQFLTLLFSFLKKETNFICLHFFFSIFVSRALKLAATNRQKIPFGDTRDKMSQIVSLDETVNKETLI
jgi:hypothetical protein